MKFSLYIVCAAAFLTSGAVVADADTVAADEDTYDSTRIELSEAQMDLITAAGFVCPVITTAAVLSSPDAVMIGEGHYSIIGPDVIVPIHATNGDGAGTPPGPHSEPGDTDYTAIWN